MNTRILLIGLTLITAFSMPLHAQQEEGVPDPSNGLSITYNIYIPDTTRDDWDIVILHRVNHFGPGGSAIAPDLFQVRFRSRRKGDLL